MIDPNLRALVRGAYDLQQQRIASGLRVVANFRDKLGMDKGKTEDNAEAKKALTVLEERYKLITDNVVEITRRRKYDYAKSGGLISTFTELALISAYLLQRQNESRAMRYVAHAVEDHPMWDAFFKGVKGCGPTMAGAVLASIDIERARHASSIWKYCGLDVVKGKGRSRHKEMMTEVEYVDKHGELKTRMSLGYNPWIKTKMIGVLGPCLIKARGDYKDVYDGYKHRLQHRPDLKEESKGHLHAMAVRYMVKRFLADMYAVWRPLEGLPVTGEYAAEKLGIVHGA